MFNTKQYKASFLEVLKLVIASNPSITDISIAWRMFSRQVRNIKITSFLNSFVISNNNTTPGRIMMSLEDYRICIANNVFVTGTSVFRVSYIDPNLDSINVDIPVETSVILNKDSQIRWISDRLSTPQMPLRDLASGGLIERPRLLGHTGFAGYEGSTGYTGFVGYEVTPHTSYSSYVNIHEHEQPIIQESSLHYSDLVTLNEQQSNKEQHKNSKIEWLKKQQEKNDVSYS